MKRPDDDRLLRRFDERLSGIEAEVPAAGSWAPGRGVRRDARSPRRGFMVRAAAGLAAVAGIVLTGTLLVGLLTSDTREPSTVGSATESPRVAPSADSIVADFVTEDVEPGVIRVLDDGARPLTRTIRGENAYNKVYIVAGTDGSVWQIGENRLIRLGDAEEHPWPRNASEPGSLATGVARLAIDEEFTVDHEGVLWLSVPKTRPSSYGPAGVSWSFDGETWHRLNPEGSPASRGVYVDTSGVTYALLADGVYRVDRGSPVLVSPMANHGERPVAANDADLRVTDDGSFWLISESDLDFYRDHGEGWQRIDVSGLQAQLPQDFSSPGIADVHADVSPNGTIWVYISAGDASVESGGTITDHALARLVGDTWQTWTQDDGVPELTFGALEDSIIASVDGRVWGLRHERDADWVCAVITSFDGSAWTSYLEDRCVHAFDVGPDGAVWVLAGDGPDRRSDPVATYLIRADAPPEPLAPVMQEVDGLETVEVEPGVLQVVSDGVREPSMALASTDGGTPKVDIVAGADGQVWVVGRREIYRLGASVTHTWPVGRHRDEPAQVEVAANDSLVMRFGLPPDGESEHRDSLWQFRDGRLRLLLDGTEVRSIDAGSDGTIHLVGDRIGHLQGGRLAQALPAPPGGNATKVAISDGSDAWSSSIHLFDIDHWGGDDWRKVTDVPLWDALPDGAREGQDPVTLAATPEGGLWVHAWLTGEDGPIGLLAHHDGSTWAAISTGPDIATLLQRKLEPTAGGSVWLVPAAATSGGTARPDGLVHYDGSTFARYLEDYSIHAFDVAPDGSVWVLAAEDVGADQQEVHTYVIPAPEAAHP